MVVREARIGVEVLWIVDVCCRRVLQHDCVVVVVCCRRVLWCGADHVERSCVFKCDRVKPTKMCCGRVAYPFGPELVVEVHVHKLLGGGIRSDGDALVFRLAALNREAVVSG